MLQLSLEIVWSACADLTVLTHVYTNVKAENLHRALEHIPRGVLVSTAFRDHSWSEEICGTAMWLQTHTFLGNCKM